MIQYRIAIKFPSSRTRLPGYKPSSTTSKGEILSMFNFSAANFQLQNRDINNLRGLW